MRESIHPAYPNTKIICACGATWETRSTSGDIHLDICSNCHPFYTGKQKLMDTEGRIERFNKKYANQPKKEAAPAAAAPAEQKAAPKAEKAPKVEKVPKAKKEKAEGEAAKAPKA